MRYMCWGLSGKLLVNGALQGAGTYGAEAESPTEASEIHSFNPKSGEYRIEIISLNEWLL